MAIKTGQGGEMMIVLRVKDDGSAVVEKFGKTSEDSAKKSSKAFDDFSAGAGISLKSVAMYAGIAAAAAVAVGVAMVKSAIDTADATGKMADKLGSTAEAISALNYVASLSNVSAQELGNSLQFMNRNLSDAAKGTGDARFAIKDLGLSAKELKDLKPEDAMLKIAEALKKIPSQADRAAIAADIFNDRTGKMLNVLKGGPATIRATMAEAERFGQVISTDTAKAAEQFNDNVTRMKANLTGLANSIMQSVVPALVRMTDAMLGNDSLDALGRQRAALANMRVELAALAEHQRTTFNFVEPGLIDRIKKVDAEIDRVDDKIIAANRKLLATSSAAASAGAGGGAINSRAAEEQAKQVADQLKQLQDRTAGEAENRARQYVKDYQTLQQALNLKLIAQEQFQQQSTALADQYESDLAEIALKDPVFQAGEKLAQALEQERVARQVALIARVEDLQGTLATEDQVEADRYARQIATLYEAWNTTIQIDEEGNTARLLSDQQFKQMREQVELEHQAKLGNITAQGILARQAFEKKTTMQQTQFVIGQLLDITNSVATQNKTMFQINKAAGIANAIINTYVGVTKALSAYPPPISFVMAAVQLAAGLAQVQQIRSAQFGSATSAPSIAGGAASPTFSADSSFGPAQTPAPSSSSQQTTTMQITILGNVIGNEEFVRNTLIPVMRQEINGRDIVFINSDSRQARELLAA